jgi:hypothetical protein
MLGTPNMVPYSATKFALTGFMEGLHYELKNDKVSKYFRTLPDHCFQALLVCKELRYVVLAGCYLSYYVS